MFVPAVVPNTGAHSHIYSKIISNFGRNTFTCGITSLISHSQVLGNGCRSRSMRSFRWNIRTHTQNINPFFNYKCAEYELNSIFQLLHLFIIRSFCNRNLTEFYIVSQTHIRASAHIWESYTRCITSIPYDSSRINIRHTTYVTYIACSMTIRMECDNCECCVRILLMRTSQLIEINIVWAFKIATAYILLRACV